MKKRYGLVMIDEGTGEIVSVLSNDSPITREQFPTRDGLGVVPTKNYRYRRFEYESDKHVRARDFLNNMAVDGATLADRKKPTAGVKLSGVPLATKFTDKGNG